MNQAVLDVAASQDGVTEWPAGSNDVIFNRWFGQGLGAWCATFVSWCCAQAGYPLPALNGPNGFSYCPSGQLHGYAAAQRWAYATGEAVPVQYAEPGDILIYSWHPFALHGREGAWITSGRYEGEAAGDHTGFVIALNGDGTVTAWEGNTSANGSQDNGGAVLIRRRPVDQVCCVWRPANFPSMVSEENDMFEGDDRAVVQAILRKLDILFDALGGDPRMGPDGIIRAIHELIQREAVQLRVVKHRGTGDLWLVNGFYKRLLGPPDNSHARDVLRYLTLIGPDDELVQDVADWDLDQFITIPDGGVEGGPAGTFEQINTIAAAVAKLGENKPQTPPPPPLPPTPPSGKTLDERMSAVEQVLDVILKRLPPLPVDA